MKVCVDYGKCNSLGVCESLLPEVFQIQDDGTMLVVDDSPDEGLRSDIQDAMDSCPTEAITIVD